MSNMKIRTDGPDWVVVGEWYGAERVLFRGTLFGCIAFRGQA